MVGAWSCNTTRWVLSAVAGGRAGSSALVCQSGEQSLVVGRWSLVVRGVVANRKRPTTSSPTTNDHRLTTYFMTIPLEAEPDTKPQLIRGIGLGSATALNMIDMIGVGPFITIPLIVTVMGGPQAMLGWVLGAVLAICDGLVWAELGAAMPGSGGAYRYLKEIYGPQKLGRAVSFLFICQLSFSAPLSLASV